MKQTRRELAMRHLAFEPGEADEWRECPNCEQLFPPSAEHSCEGSDMRRLGASRGSCDYFIAATNGRP